MTTARRAWRTRGAARAMPLLSLRQATRHDLPSFHGHFGEFYSSPRLCLLFTATRPTVPVPSHGTRAEKALEFRFCCQRSDWTGRRSISGERMQAALVRPAETQRPAHKQVAGRVRLLRALTRTRGCRRPCGLALQHQPWTSGLSQGRRVAAWQGSCRSLPALSTPSASSAAWGSPHPGTCLEACAALECLSCARARGLSGRQSLWAGLQRRCWPPLAPTEHPLARGRQTGHLERLRSQELRKGCC